MKWTREDFLGDAVTTARKLIGAVIVSKTPEGITAGRIVECEAYGETYQGHKDDGAHVFKGLTPRTRIIFGEGGHAYVYLIYGMYTCLNFVCGHEGESGSVLIRALEPLEGLDLMKKEGTRQKKTPHQRPRPPHPGPGHRHVLLRHGPYRRYPLRGNKRKRPLAPGNYKTENIDYAIWGKDFPWRFLLKGSPYVSK